MKKCFFVTLILAAILSGVVPIDAQNNGRRVPVTRDNVARLAPLARMGHGTITALAWSPDGERLAVGGSVGLWLYDARDLAAPPRLLAETERGLRWATYSPDGSLIATGMSQGTVTLWQAESGALQHEIDSGMHDVTRVIFSPDGTRIAVVGNSGEARVFEIATGNQIVRVRNSYSVFGPIAFSPDGQWLAVGDNNGTAWVWDIATGKETAKLSHDTANTSGGFVPIPLEVREVLFSSDGKTLISVTGWDSQPVRKGSAIWFWDVTTGQNIEMAQDKIKRIDRIAYDSADRLWAIGSAGDSFGIWDARTGEQRVTVPAAAQGEGVAYVLDRELTRLAASTFDGTLTVWDLVTGSALFSRAGDAVSPDRPPVFSPDGHYLAIVNPHKGISLWDVLSETQVAFLTTDEGDPTTVAFGQDPHSLFAGGIGGSLLRWDISPQPEASPEFAGSVTIHHGWIEALAFSPDWTLLATGATSVNGEGEVELWDLRTGNLFAVFAPEEGMTVSGSGPLHALALSPDGRTLATMGQTVRLWDISTPEKPRLLYTLDAPDYEPEYIAFNPADGSLLTADAKFDEAALNFTGGRVVRWDSATGDQQALLYDSDQQMGGFSFNADGSLVAVSRMFANQLVGGPIQLWDPQTGEVLAEPIQGSHAHTFSPDGTLLAVVDTNSTIWLWGIDEQ